MNNTPLYRLSQALCKENAERFFLSISEGRIDHAQHMLDFQERFGCTCCNCAEAESIMRESLKLAHAYRDATEGRR